MQEELFPYQKQGVQFLTKNRYSMLADEMGLGKTVQAIRGLDSIHAKNILVICPSIARINWHREFIHWSNVNRSYFVAKNLNERPKKGQSLICSYEYITENYDKLDIIFDQIVVDEAHYLKEPKSKRTKAVLGNQGIIRKSKGCWFLSGTPAPNNASELWPILYTCGITKLKYDKFVDYFCITRKTDYGIKIEDTNRSKIPELIKLIKPFMLRRVKKDVMKELPPISYGWKVIEPGFVDFEVLPSFSKYMMPTQRWDELEKDILKEKKLMEDIWNNMDSESMDAVNALNAVGKSVATVRRIMGLQKVENTIAHVKKMFHGKAVRKLVIFAIHQDVIQSLYDGLKEFKPVTLYGGTPEKKRQKNIDKFQNTHSCRIFIGNIQACGVAIDLTAASNIIFIEQDWVPGNNAQAVMRCHRIGQKHPVSVQFYVLADSLDERISFVLKKKTKSLTELFDKDLIDTTADRYTWYKKYKDIVQEYEEEKQD